MSLIHYFSEKRACMEKFYLSALRVLDRFYSVPPYQDDWNNEQLEKGSSRLIFASDTIIDEIRDAYGNLDFVLGNKKLRNKMCYKTYNGIRSDVKYLLEKSYFFRGFIEGKGTEENARSRYKAFSDEWFYEETGETIEEQYIAYSVYSKHCDTMASSLEELRSKIYNKKPDIHVYRPVYSGIKEKSNSSIKARDN